MAIIIKFLDGSEKEFSNLSGSNLSGSNLSRSDLSGSDLSGSDLSGSNLSGSYFNEGKVIGERPFIQFGPIGREERIVLCFSLDTGIYVRAGCFWGSIDDFSKAIEETHGISKNGDEYHAFVLLIKKHYEIWSA